MLPSRSPTLIFTHPDCLGHYTGVGHVESPARLRAALRGLQHPDFSALEYREAPCADIADLAAVHTTVHITKTFALIPTQGLWNLDPDTVVSPGSRAAALRAAGGLCRGRRGHDRGSRQCLWRRAASRPSCRRPSRGGASAYSTTSQSAPRVPARGTASNVSPSSISISTTATAPRASSGTTAASSLPLFISGLSIREREPRPKRRA